MATGLCCSAGLPAFAGVIAGIAAGALCGAFNGFLIAYVGMPAVIVTIASSMLFRGICKNHSGCKCIERVSKLLHVCGVDKYSGNSNCTVIVFRNGISICICSS